MSLNLRDVRQALASALGTVDGLHVSPTPPERIPSTPFAYIGLFEGEYNRRFGRSKGATQVTVPVTVVVDLVNSEGGIDLLDDFASQHEEATPRVRIKDAIESDPTLGGVCGAVLVTDFGNPRPKDFAGTNYIALDFSVTVHT